MVREHFGHTVARMEKSLWTIVVLHDMQIVNMGLLCPSLSFILCCLSEHSFQSLIKSFYYIVGHQFGDGMVWYEWGVHGASDKSPLEVLKYNYFLGFSYIMKMRDRLERATQVVKMNLDIAKQTWYDQNSRQREFHQGYQVLVLLPTSSNKLLAQWQGPYEVVKPIGKVDYLIHMYDRRKKRRIFHVNMLKQWYVPTNTGYIAEEIQADYVDEDIPTWTDYDEDNSTD